MNVALVKLSALGDVIHALPLASALRRGFPRARLVWIVEAREAPLLQGHPDLDEIVTVDTRRWRRQLGARGGLRRGLREVAMLARELRAQRFDVAIDAQGLVKSGLVTACTRAPWRIGFAASWGREPLSALFTNSRVIPPPSARHVVDQYCALLGPLGLQGGARVFHVPVDPAADAVIERWCAANTVKPGERIVALAPGAGRAEKRWPLSHFATLASRLVAEASARVLLVWGPGERPLADAIHQATRPSVMIAPPTSIPELAALLRRCSVVVAGDTGPLHLAAAVESQAIGLFGPTRGERNGPYGRHGRVVQSADGTVASIAPERVFEAVVSVLP